MINEEELKQVPTFSMQQVLAAAPPETVEDFQLTRRMYELTQMAVHPEHPMYGLFYMLLCQCRNCWAVEKAVVPAAVSVHTLNNMMCAACGEMTLEVTPLTSCRKIMKKK